MTAQDKKIFGIYGRRKVRRLGFTRIRELVDDIKKSMDEGDHTRREWVCKGFLGYRK